jgi:tetratricopeptide (TPR) repeat protein
VASQETALLLEKLNELIARRPKGPPERSAYVESCRNLLSTIDRSAEPYWWAALEAELGMTLASFFTPDRASRLEEAIDAYQKALEVFTPKDYPTEWISTNGSLALAYRERIEGVPRENLNRAIEEFSKVLEFSPREKDPAGWARTESNLAYAYEGLAGVENPSENLRRSVEYCEEALQVFTRAAYPIEWAQVNALLGNINLRQVSGVPANNIDAAIRCYGNALGVYTRRTTPDPWALTHMNLGNAYQRRITGVAAENFESAIENYDAALEVFTKEGNPTRWAETSMNLGNVYRRRIRGDRLESQERAIQLYEAALQLLGKKNWRDWGLTEMNLGNVYLERNRGNPTANFVSAIQAYGKALEVLTKDKEPRLWAQVQINLGCAYARDSGSKEAAIHAFESVLEVLNPNEQALAWAQAKTNLATAYQNRVSDSSEDYVEKAIQTYQDVTAICQCDTRPVEWAAAMQGLANAYQKRVKGNRAENLARAIASLQDMLSVYRLTNWPREHLKTQFELAMLLFREQRWQEAANAFQAGLAAHTVLYRAASTPEARQSELRGVRGMSGALAYSLAKTGNLAEAVLALENGRARTIEEFLALEETPLTELRLEDQAAFQRIREHIRDLQGEARWADHEGPHRDFVSLSQDLGQAYAEMDAIVRRVQGYLPGFLSSPIFEEVEAAATICPLVYVLSAGPSGLGLVVRGRTGGGIAALWLPDLAAEHLLAHVRAYARSYASWRASPSSPATQKDWLNTLDDTLHWIWDAAMGPLVGAVGEGQQAALIPVGSLGLMPLHAAWTEDLGKVTGRHYALDSVMFRYAPSARVFLAASKSAAQTAFSFSILAVEEPKPVKGGPLPNAAHEVWIATRHFESIRVLRHEQAKREQLLKEVADYSTLHFCCHGVANLFEPLDSGLAMGNDEKLRLRDLLQLRLPNGRLAVLSACETSLAGTDLPDEVFSLPGGLMQAGVDGIVGSMWSVSDVSTMMLMARFYDFWRDDKIEPVEALRRAQQWVRDTTNREKKDYFIQEFVLDMLAGHAGDNVSDLLIRELVLPDPDSRDYAHPFNWAAFSYVGA